MLCRLSLCSPLSRVLLSRSPAAPGTAFRESALQQPRAVRGAARSPALRTAVPEPRRVLAGVGCPCGIAACGEGCRGPRHGSRRSRWLLLQALLPTVDCAAAKVSAWAFPGGKGMDVRVHPRARTLGLSPVPPPLPSAGPRR